MFVCVCVCVHTGSGCTVALNLGCYDYSGDGKIVQSLVGGQSKRKTEGEGKTQQRGCKELKRGGKMSPSAQEEKIRTFSTESYNSALQ